MEKEELLVKLIQTIPYPYHISDLDMSSEADAIRFTWRSTKFRVSLGGSVEELQEKFLRGSDIAILLEALIFNEQSSLLFEHQVV